MLKLVKNKKAFSLIEISIVILIIGILIAGVASGSRLIYKSKISSAQNLTLAAPVHEIAGLSIWLDTVTKNVFVDASGSRSISDKEKISKWYDISPIAKSSVFLQQSSSSSQPTFIKNGINGLPAIYFDSDSSGSTGKYLSSSQYFTEFGNASYTIFLVVKKDNNEGAFFSYIFSYLNYDGSNYIGHSFGTRDNTWYGFQSYGGFAQFDTGVNANSGAPLILEIVYDKSPSSSGTIQIFINGVQRHNSSGWGYNGAGLNTSRISLGASYVGSFGSPQGFFDGYLSEFIIYDRVIESDDRDAIRQYLARKWAIKI